MRRRIWLVPGLWFVDVTMDAETWAVVRRLSVWLTWSTTIAAGLWVTLLALLGWPLSPRWAALVVVAFAVVTLGSIPLGLLLATRRGGR